MKTYATLNASQTITKEMQAIPQQDLESIWNQYSSEHLKLSKWLRTSFPKRETGKVSKYLYQSKHSRHLELDRVLGNARICSSVFFKF